MTATNGAAKSTASSQPAANGPQILLPFIQASDRTLVDGLGTTVTYKNGRSQSHAPRMKMNRMIFELLSYWLTKNTS
jgi:hypothetical protein